MQRRSDEDQRMTQAYSTRSGSAAWDEAWTAWQQEVVAVIRRDFPEVLRDIGQGDIDWEAWRPLYDRGHGAEAAVDRAFLRNL